MVRLAGDCPCSLAAGLLLEIFWLMQVGFIIFFAFIMGLWGISWQRWQWHREVREVMARILREQEEKGFDPLPRLTLAPSPLPKNFLPFPPCHIFPFRYNTIAT